MNSDNISTIEKTIEEIVGEYDDLLEASEILIQDAISRQHFISFLEKYNEARLLRYFFGPGPSIEVIEHSPFLMRAIEDQFI